jgi:hypothetical protein
MAAKQVNRAVPNDLKRAESQKRLRPKKAKPIKTGTIPIMALPTIGKVKETVLVIREY